MAVRLRKPNRGRRQQARGRFVGQGRVQDGFFKNPQVDGGKGGTRTQEPCSPEWCGHRGLDLNCSTGPGV